MRRHSHDRACAVFHEHVIGYPDRGRFLIDRVDRVRPQKEAGLFRGVLALAFSFARRARDILIAVPILLSWKYREAAALLADRKPTTLGN